jgi:hypothetical protein
LGRERDERERQGEREVRRSARCGRRDDRSMFTGPPDLINRAADDAALETTTMR